MLVICTDTSHIGILELSRQAVAISQNTGKHGTAIYVSPHAL